LPLPPSAPPEPDPLEPDPLEPDPLEPDPLEPDPLEPDPLEPPLSSVGGDAESPPVRGTDDGEVGLVGLLTDAEGVSDGVALSLGSALVLGSSEGDPVAPTVGAMNGSSGRSVSAVPTEDRVGPPRTCALSAAAVPAAKSTPATDNAVTAVMRRTEGPPR
jgi:hypothetical protein